MCGKPINSWRTDVWKINKYLQPTHENLAFSCAANVNTMRQWHTYSYIPTHMNINTCFPKNPGQGCETTCLVW